MRWLASQLEEDMCRPAAGIPNAGALPGQPAGAGAGTAKPGVSKVPKRRFESPKMVPLRSQNGTFKVSKWDLKSPKMVPSDSEKTVTDTTSDLRFFDQSHPFVPTLKKIEKKERKKEEEKEKETMEQIYIALLQDYVEPEPYVPIATNLNSVAVDTSADPAAFNSDSLTAPTLDTEPDTAEVGIKADATNALSGANSEMKNKGGMVWLAGYLGSDINASRHNRISFPILTRSNALCACFWVSKGCGYQSAVFRPLASLSSLLRPARYMEAKHNSRQGGDGRARSIAAIYLACPISRRRRQARSPTKRQTTVRRTALLDGATPISYQQRCRQQRRWRVWQCRSRCLRESWRTLAPQVRNARWQRRQARPTARRQ